MKKKIIFILLMLVLVLIIFFSLSSKENALVEIPSRESLIPADKIKMTPENDKFPPKLYSDEYEIPIPLPYPVNTKGAEDSAFIMPDGKTIYIWFTPDPNIDVSKQVIDKVTGIYKFNKQGDGWSEPERLWFVEPGTPHLDGCGFFQDNKVWLCAVREDYTGIHWFTSNFENGKWSIAEISDFNPEYEIGELHISNNGKELYFHSSRPGGKGGLDIWMSKKVNGEWQDPENLENVNTDSEEGWPALNTEENELWISKNYGLWRSKRVNGEWQVPEEIISSLAGEATIDEKGNIYFTHHYYNKDKMIEADIYVAYKK